ncbi:MAG TPA: hypothetical protein VLE97_11700 [Gaiellaceae bacterium]|nr:hypothetical protein [Gaiellaceae bacterium]
MRVAWKAHAGDYWTARVGPCWITLSRMSPYHPRARDHREVIDRTWVYSVRDPLGGKTLVEDGVFEVARDRYEGGDQEARERAVALTRELAPCKRTRTKRDPVAPLSAAWLEERLLDALRRSYGTWRENTARYGRGVYPEPRLSTALLALEAAQYGGRPDDLDVPKKRFYAIVVATLGRLKKQGLVTSSSGLDYSNKPARLWEPA